MRAALAAANSNHGRDASLEEADISIQSNAPPEEPADNGILRINSGMSPYVVCSPIIIHIFDSAVLQLY